MTKLTDVELLRRANSFTTGRDSHMTLAKAYRAGHSPIRTQLFWVECTDIPLFVASQLVRSHVGVQFFQRSKRTDRGGEDFRKECESIADSVHSLRSSDIDREQHVDICQEIVNLPLRFDRYAPTDLMCLINAEAIINMSRKRLCTKASKETREIWQKVCELIEECDPDLYQYLVPQCVYRGGICPESKCCGYIASEKGQSRLKFYKALFNQKNNSK